jgi:hypothetical protein
MLSWAQKYGKILTPTFPKMLTVQNPKVNFTRLPQTTALPMER